MAAPASIRSAYQDFFFSTMLPALEEVFDSSLLRHPDRRPELFDIRSSSESVWQYTETHDLSLMKQMSEGEDYDFERMKQGADKSLTPVKFGLGFSISQEMIEDGKHDFVADAVRKLAKSARETQEVSGMNIFNNGFTTETTADGVSLFNDAHTLPSGGSYRNRLSTDADLSVTSLQQMIEDYETQPKGDSGILYRTTPTVLLVHPSNRLLAKELLKSELKPETADNNMNSLRDEGMRAVSSPHLSDDDAWFMLSSPEETGLRVIERRAISTSVDEVFLNDSIRYKTSYREVVGAVHGYGSFGTQGA